jgi:hypothetical protein
VAQALSNLEVAGGRSLAVFRGVGDFGYRQPDHRVIRQKSAVKKWFLDLERGLGHWKRVEGSQERRKKGAQKIRDTLQEAEDLPEIETSGGEQCVAAVAGAALQPVSAEQSVVLGVADDGFDDRAAFQPAFDFVGDAAFLARDVHRGVGMTGETVSFVSLIDCCAQWTSAHHIPHIVESSFQRVAVIRIAV